MVRNVHPGLYILPHKVKIERCGDMRILELLIQKDEEAVKNIGDPAEFMGVYDIEEEEKITAKAIEYGQSPDEFEKLVTSKVVDPLSILFGDEEPPSGKDTETKTLSMPSLFENDYTYLNASIDHLRHSGGIQAAPAIQMKSV